MTSGTYVQRRTPRNGLRRDITCLHVDVAAIGSLTIGRPEGQGSASESRVVEFVEGYQLCEVNVRVAIFWRRHNCCSVIGIREKFQSL